MRKLLLISSSKVHPTGYLEHCADAVGVHLTGVRRLLFVPFALADQDGYAATARQRFAEMGFEVDALHDASDPVEAVARAEAMFVGG